MIMGGLILILRPISLIRTVVLARLLAPEDFGAVALAMVYLGSTGLFANLRMGAAYVQSGLDSHKVAFHAFIISFVASSLIFVFTVANAPWLATLLGDESIVPIIRVLSVTIVIQALVQVPSSILQKQLNFGALAKITFYATVVYVLSSITLAFLGFGVWSLVVSDIIRVSVTLVFTWLLVPGWDWLKPVPWDWSVVHALLRFGIPATGSGFLSYASSKWDDWLVGRQLGIEALGYYSKAYDFTNRTIRRLGDNVVGSVFFPTYAKIRHDAAKLQRSYIKSVQLVSTVMFPLALGLFVTAPLLIPVVLGQKWTPMIAAYQVFAILILTRPISRNATSFYNALGLPKYNIQAGIVLIAGLVPLALLLLPYGITGVAVAVLISDTMALGVNLFRTNRLSPGALKLTLKASLPALLAATIMMVAVYPIQNYLISSIGMNIWSLFLVAGIGGLIFLLGSLLFQRDFTQEVAALVIKIIDRGGHLQRVRARVWSS